jgi:hypothetical protein
MQSNVEQKIMPFSAEKLIVTEELYHILVTSMIFKYITVLDIHLCYYILNMSCILKYLLG